jgi:hypothetical protein
VCTEGAPAVTPNRAPANPARTGDPCNFPR